MAVRHRHQPHRRPPVAGRRTSGPRRAGTPRGRGRGRGRRLRRRRRRGGPAGRRIRDRRPPAHRSGRASGRDPRRRARPVRRGRRAPVARGAARPQPLGAGDTADLRERRQAGPHAGSAARRLVHYVLGATAQTSQRADDFKVDRTEFLDAASRAWQDLDPDDYPFMRAVADQMREHDDREQFLTGVAALHIKGDRGRPPGSGVRPGTRPGGRRSGPPGGPVRGRPPRSSAVPRGRRAARG